MTVCFTASLVCISKVDRTIDPSRVVLRRSETMVPCLLLSWPGTKLPCLLRLATTLSCLLRLVGLFWLAVWLITKGFSNSAFRRRAISGSSDWTRRSRRILTLFRPGDSNFAPIWLQLASLAEIRWGETTEINCPEYSGDAWNGSRGCGDSSLMLSEGVSRDGGWRGRATRVEWVCEWFWQVMRTFVSVVVRRREAVCEVFGRRGERWRSFWRILFVSGDVVCLVLIGI